MDVDAMHVHPAYMPTKTKRQEAPAPIHFLREWRVKREMTLEEVAPKLGITHATLSRIERGIIPYNQHHLERLAVIYGCAINDLLTKSP